MGIKHLEKKFYHLFIIWYFKLCIKPGWWKPRLWQVLSLNECHQCASLVSSPNKELFYVEVLLKFVFQSFLSSWGDLKLGNSVLSESMEEAESATMDDLGAGRTEEWIDLLPSARTWRGLAVHKVMEVSLLFTEDQGLLPSTIMGMSKDSKRTEGLLLGAHNPVDP